MIIDPQLVPGWLVLVSSLLMAAGLAAAAALAPWRMLLSAPERQHVVLGGAVALLLLWLGSFEVTEGIRLHLLAVTCATMIAGLPLTVLGGTVALLAQLWLLDVPLVALPVSWLPTLAVPAVASRLLVHLLRRRGPKHFFVYLLGAGFGGGMASVLASACCAFVLFLLMGRADLVVSAFESAPLVVLMMFPEGFLNGMLITAFTVFSPDLVKTFDDEYYLDS